MEFSKKKLDLFADRHMTLVANSGRSTLLKALFNGKSALEIEQADTKSLQLIINGFIKHY